MRPKAIVFDITGTLRYANNQATPGADAAIAAIRAAGYAVRCLSNNPREAPEQVVASLREAGLIFSPDEVLTANAVTAGYLAERYRGRSVAILEMSTVLSETVAAQGVIVDGSQTPEAVVIALGAIGSNPPDRERLVHAADLVRAGATLLATNVDHLVPLAPMRFIPASGSFVAVVEALAGAQATVIGKPSAWAAAALLRSLAMPGTDLVMVGDHLESDVAFGQRMGARTALVLTGVAFPWQRPAIEAMPEPPSVVLDSVADLPAWLAGLD